MLLRAVGKGLAKVFSKSAEVLFLQSVKCVSSFLPSPADFPSLESLLYNAGYYNRVTFTLYIQISRIRLNSSKHEYQILVKTANESHNSRCFRNEYMKMPVDMAFKLVVKPYYANLCIEIVERKLIVDKVIASLNIDIDNDIIGRSFPKNKKYDLLNGGKYIGDITLSFHHVPCIVHLDSELWHKAVIKFVECEMEVSDFLDGPDREDKLEIMSTLLKGQMYIQSASGIGWKRGYFNVVNNNDYYTWNIYESELSCIKSGKPTIVIPMLMIKCVTRESENTFKITYLSGECEEELTCKHEFADTWVEASNFYIQMLRRHLEHLPSDIFNISTESSTNKCIRSTIHNSVDQENKLPECIKEMYTFMNSPP